MSIVDQNLICSPLTHPRLSAIKCWDELLEGCKTLSCFIGRIEKFAAIISRAETEEGVEGIFDQFGVDGANNFKGDVTEVFAEYVLKRHGAAWGIYNYSPIFAIENEQDVGVDGVGETSDGTGRVVTVQVKYGNYTEDLDSARRGLDSFHWTSLDKYSIGTDSKDQMFIFTLSGSIHWRTREVSFHRRLKFISQKESGGLYAPNNTNDVMPIYNLNSISKNDVVFWQTFHYMTKGEN